MNKLNINQIKMLKSVLYRPFSDPYVEVPIVNTTLQILGFAGQFEFNDKTNKITWKIDKNH